MLLHDTFATGLKHGRPTVPFCDNLAALLSGA